MSIEDEMAVPGWQGIYCGVAVKTIKQTEVPPDYFKYTNSIWNISVFENGRWELRDDYREFNTFDGGFRCTSKPSPNTAVLCRIEILQKCKHFMGIDEESGLEWCP